MRVEASVIHHEHVHGRVKISVVDHVVNVSIDIVVIPTGLYGMKILVIIAGLDGYGHGLYSPRIRIVRGQNWRGHLTSGDPINFRLKPVNLA